MVDINGNGIKVNASIVGTIAFLIAQLVGGVIWIANLGARVDQLEKSRPEFRTQVFGDIANINRRIDEIDSKGTRALNLVEDRQQEVIRRLKEIENRK